MTRSAGITQESSPSAGVTLTVESLSVHYGGVCAVSSISFVVGQGQAVGIIGANGAGKTSTLKALMGLVPRSGGRIRLGTHDLNKVAPHEMVRHGIGYVPEGRHVFAGLPVEKNLLLGAYARAWGKETDQALAEVYELFPVLGEMRGRLAGVLQRLRGDGLSLLLVEQNAKLTFEATSDCLVMENGKVAMTGPAAELRHDTRVRRIYLGL